MALIKIHGTADNFHTVRSTVSDLSRVAMILERMAFVSQPERLLIIGYSGRDFDLFPFVAALARESEILWVDPSFPDGHRARSLAHAKLFEGTWETLVGGGAPAQRTSRDLDTGARYAERVRQAAEAHIGALLRSDPDRAIAAFVAVLSATGAMRDAIRLAARYESIGDRRARFSTALWAAHANSSLDRLTTPGARQRRRDASHCVPGRCQNSAGVRSQRPMPRPPTLGCMSGTTRLMPSARALMSLVCTNSNVSGHQASTAASWRTSGMVVPAHHRFWAVSSRRRLA